MTYTDLIDKLINQQAIKGSKILFKDGFLLTDEKEKVIITIKQVLSLDGSSSTYEYVGYSICDGMIFEGDTLLERLPSLPNLSELKGIDRFGFGKEKAILRAEFDTIVEQFLLGCDIKERYMKYLQACLPYKTESAQIIYNYFIEAI